MTLALPSRRLAPAWVRNDLWRRARAVPSLDLRFAENKSLVDAVSGQNLVTFTRASGGTYLDSAGVIRTATTNEPRFDHNPTTGECLGLLVEEQRTNHVLGSAGIGGSQWLTEVTGTGSAPDITLNAATSPDNTTTASLIVLDLNGGTTLSDRSGVYQSVGSVIGQPQIHSVWLKTSDGTTKTVRLDFTGIAADLPPYNSSNVTVTGVWQRFVVGLASPTDTARGFYIRLRGGQGTSNSASLHVWGAQCERNAAFPTSYIPTTGSAATRNADVADIINTAIANGIRTLYAEFRSPASGIRGVVSLNDNTANERAAINTSGTDPRLVIVDGGVTQADIDAGTIVASARSRMAVRISANNFAASFNGGAVVTDTSGTLPTVDRLFIGRTQAGEYLNAPIARLVGWREELPDSTLQALTQS